MRSVRMDVLSPTGEWHRVGQVADLVAPGSISTYPPEGRQVYVFGWLDHGGEPGVWQSRSGVDVEDSVLRLIHSDGFERVATLSADSPIWWMDYVTASGETGRLRFTLEGS